VYINLPIQTHTHTRTHTHTPVPPEFLRECRWRRRLSHRVTRSLLKSYMCVRVCVCVCMHGCTSFYLYKQTHTHAHTHTYPCVPRVFQRVSLQTALVPSSRAIVTRVVPIIDRIFNRLRVTAAPLRKKKRGGEKRGGKKRGGKKKGGENKKIRSHVNGGDWVTRSSLKWSQSSINRLRVTAALLRKKKRREKKRGEK